MVITQGGRVAIRKAHAPAGSSGLCAVCDQPPPCDVVRLIDELEAVEAVARAQFQEVAALRRSIAELDARIHRAVLDIHHAIEDLT